MRSNKMKATRFVLRRHLYIGVIVFIAAFFLFPFWALSNIPEQKEIITQHYVPSSITEQLTQLVSSNVMAHPLNLELMVILYGSLGFLTALLLMQHLFSRRQSLMLAALPDRREWDFLRRCVAYAVLCVAPIVLNLLLYLLIVAANGLFTYIAWGTLLPKFFLLLLVNLYGFSMGMLSSVITGTYWAALLAGAVMIAGAEGLAFLWYTLAEKYLHTLVEASFKAPMLHLSPAYSLYKGVFKPEEFIWLPGVAAIVLALVLSFVLYRIRRAERAEHTLIFLPLHSLMGFLLPVLGGSLFGYVVLMSFGTESALIAGMIIGAFFTYWVCRIVFNQRICGILKQAYLPAAAAALLILGVAILHTDAFGYDRFLPQREEIDSISYRARSYHSDEYTTLTDSSALDAAYEWCRLMREETDTLTDGLNAPNSTNYESSVTVTYQIGGRTVYRRYPNDSCRLAAQDSLQRVIESNDYRQSLIREFHLDDGCVRNMYVNNHFNGGSVGDLFGRFGLAAEYFVLERSTDSAAVDAMTTALREDILSRTFAEKQQDPIYNITFTITLPDQRTHLYRNLDIYPGDENVLRLLLGEKSSVIVSHITGGYAADEDLVALKVTYEMNRKELEHSGIAQHEATASVQCAATPEEAVSWVRRTLDFSALSYYYMPDREDESFSRLYIYRLSEIERYLPSGIPEDLTQLYDNTDVPTTERRQFIGE